MEFGPQFFPNVGPAEKSGQQYWNECLSLVGLCDELGFTQVRSVEHYFEPYGGYSPSPPIFPPPPSQPTAKARPGPPERIMRQRMGAVERSKPCGRGSKADPWAEAASPVSSGTTLR